MTFNEFASEQPFNFTWCEIYYFSEKKKKGLEWEFQGWNDTFLMALLCSIVICWIALEFWAHIALAYVRCESKIAV